jgi:hypothetical protein
MRRPVATSNDLFPKAPAGLSYCGQLAFLDRPLFPPRKARPQPQGAVQATLPGHGPLNNAKLLKVVRPRKNWIAQKKRPQPGKLGPQGA